MACLILSVGTPFVPSRRYLLRTTIRMAFFTPSSRQFFLKAQTRITLTYAHPALLKQLSMC